MRRWKPRMIGLVMVSGPVGSVAVPRVAAAVGTIVTIQGGGSTNKAGVDRAQQVLPRGGGAGDHTRLLSGSGRPRGPEAVVVAASVGRLEAPFLIHTRCENAPGAELREGEVIRPVTGVSTETFSPSKQGSPSLDHPAIRPQHRLILWVVGVREDHPVET